MRRLDSRLQFASIECVEQLRIIREACEGIEPALPQVRQAIQGRALAQYAVFGGIQSDIDFSCWTGNESSSILADYDDTSNSLMRALRARGSVYSWRDGRGFLFDRQEEEGEAEKEEEEEDEKEEEDEEEEEEAERTVAAAIGFVEHRTSKDLTDHREITEDELNPKHMIDDEEAVFLVQTMPNGSGGVKRRFMLVAGTNTYLFTDDKGSYSCIDTGLSRQRKKHMDDVYDRDAHDEPAVWCLHYTGLTYHGAKCASILTQDDGDEVAIVSGDVAFVRKLEQYKQLHPATCKYTSCFFYEILKVRVVSNSDFLYSLFKLFFFYFFFL